MMIKIPAFKNNLHVEVVSGEGVLILSESAAKELHGSTYEKIVPLIDGKRSSDEIVDALLGEVDAARVYYALRLLEKAGLITEYTSENNQKKMPSATSSLDELAATARWAAAARAEESARSDRLFCDPWAEKLAGDVGKAWQKKFDVSEQLAVRTKFFDDFLLEATDESQMQQVVILAAGMDSRAFRLSWSDRVKLFEVDQPEVMALKESVFVEGCAVPLCQRKSIGIDLSDSWQDALLDAGFDPEQPSVWLLEGLLAYLPEQVALEILGSVAALASKNSWLAIDMVNQETLTSPLSRSLINVLAEANVPWRFGSNEPKSLLSSCGWNADLIQTFDVAARRYDRQIRQYPFRAGLGRPDSFLITAKRQAV